MRSRSDAASALPALRGPARGPGRADRRLPADRRGRLDRGDRCDGVDMGKPERSNLNECSVFSMTTMRGSRNPRVPDLGIDPALFRGTIACAARQKIHAVS